MAVSFASKVERTRAALRSMDVGLSNFMTASEIVFEHVFDKKENPDRNGRVLYIAMSVRMWHARVCATKRRI